MKFGKVMEIMEHEVKVEGSYERSWKIMEYEMEKVEEWVVLGSFILQMFAYK
ncbi:unnamed protein product [Camellia sinensis]